MRRSIFWFERHLALCALRLAYGFVLTVLDRALVKGVKDIEGVEVSTSVELDAGMESIAPSRSSPCLSPLAFVSVVNASSLLVSLG